MKRKPIFGLLLVMLFLLTAFAEKQPNKPPRITESQAKELAQEVLDGRPVRVRVYNNWQADPRAYRIVIVPLTGLSLSHDTIRKAFPGINEWTIVVIVGQDQVDEAVAAVVDDFVYVDTYGPKKSLSIWPAWSRVPDYTYWVFTDALGDPIPKASVEILLRSYFDESQEIYLGKAVLDAKGRLKPLTLCNSFFRFVFVISHPKYGKAAVERYFSNEQSDGYVMRYVVPLVPMASQAASRAVQGHVVDPEGNALEAMPVTCDHIRTANDSPLNIYKGFYGRSVTDEQGWFTMYMPLEESGELSRSLIPAGVQYDLSVVPPKSLNVHSYHEKTGVPAGGYRLITLASIRPDKHFHTFAFEDERGLITDPEELQRISVTLTRGLDRRQWLKLEYGQWKDGFSLQEGILRVETRRWDQLFYFEPIELTSESPKELVFKAGEQIIYQGVVVEGSTGEPMANVLVLVKHSDPGEGFAGSPDEQLEALRARALRQEIEGLSDRTLYEYDDRVTLTDRNGRYQFIFRTGLKTHLGRFTALEKGYAAEETVLGAIYRPNRAGIVELSPIRLVPEKEKYWPGFVFEDQSGAVITDPNILEQIHFTIERDEGNGRRGWSRSYSSLMEGNEFIRGTYYATLDWQGQRNIFGPAEVTWGGPVEVVFKVREVRPTDIIYQGGVINGITGAPMPGVVVMRQFRAIDKLDASAVLSEQWDAIRRSGPQPDPNDAALIPLREAFQFDKITRADAAGQFQLPLGRQEFPSQGRLIAVQEDFLGAQQELRYLVPRDKNDSERTRLAEFQPDADGCVKLPAMKLYPAATLAVEPNLPYLEGTKHRVRFCFHTLPDDPTPWLKDLWATPGGAMGASVLCKYDLRPNELQTVYVLAGLEVILKIDPMLPQKAPVTIGAIRLKQGQFLDLGRQDFQPAFEVTVKVIDPGGEPVEGVAVRCRDVDGFSWGLSGRGRMPITDENGKSALYVPAHSKGEFIVTSYDRASDTHLHEGTPYEVAGEAEDAGKQFTLQLSDEMLSLLRK